MIGNTSGFEAAVSRILAEVLTYTLNRNPALYTLHRTLYTLNPTPYTLHPTPYTLHPTPYTLHPTPYTLQPTPYTLPPTPSTPNTKTGFVRRGRKRLSFRNKHPRPGRAPRRALPRSGTCYCVPCTGSIIQICTKNGLYNTCMVCICTFIARFGSLNIRALGGLLAAHFLAAVLSIG